MKKLDNLQIHRRIAITALVACVAAACGGAVAASQTTAQSHRRQHEGASPRTSKRVRVIHDVLYGNGIGEASFGEKAIVAIKRIDFVLERKPGKSYYSNHACGVDHESDWPGVNTFFSHGRLVGYSYWAAGHRGTVILATAKRLRIGDWLTKGERLYGRAFRVSPAQGGSWSAKTKKGRIFGYTSGDPNGPRAAVASVEAGDVGCPGMTP